MVGVASFGEFVRTLLCEQIVATVYASTLTTQIVSNMKNVS